MRLNLTKPEAEVVLDALVHLTAFTHQEFVDHLGWTDEQIEAWSSALRKVDLAVTS